MADEKKPTNDIESGESTAARDADAQGTDPNISYAEAQEKPVRELRDTPVEVIDDAKLPEEVKNVVDAEGAAGRQDRRETEAVLNKPIEAIEDAVNALDARTAPERVVPAAHAAAAHADHDVVTFGGMSVPLYTAIFGILAVITIIEVVLAELPDGWLQTVLLVVLSAIKAVLVVAFYMHLREDSRLFLASLLLPLFIGIVAMLFLLSVPTTGYSY